MKNLILTSALVLGMTLFASSASAGPVTATTYLNRAMDIVDVAYGTAAGFLPDIESSSFQTKVRVYDHLREANRRVNVAADMTDSDNGVRSHILAYFPSFGGAACTTKQCVYKELLKLRDTSVFQ